MGQYISMNFLQRGFIHQVGTSDPVCELCPAHVPRPLCSCSCNPAPCLGVGEHCSSGLKNFQSSHQATSRGPCMGVEEHNLHFEGIFCRLTVGGNHRLWNGSWSCPIHSGWSYIECFSSELLSMLRINFPIPGGGVVHPRASYSWILPRPASQVKLDAKLLHISTRSVSIQMG